MATLIEIEVQAKALADARSQLTFMVTALQDDITRCKRAKLPQIKEALAAAVNAQNVLQASVAASPELFKKPRTQIFHAIKVGFQKQKGKLTWTDISQVVKLIRKHCRSEAKVLLKTTVTPQRDALSKLSADTLKKLGIAVEADSDAVVVKPVDAEIDKLVNALMDAEVEKPQAAAPEIEEAE